MRYAAAVILAAGLMSDFSLTPGAVGTAAQPTAAPQQQVLYVALPGADDAGGDRSVRILVFDVAREHRFVRRIHLWPARGDDGEVVRAVAADARGGRLYLSTSRRLAAIDVKTDKVVWEKSYEDHCCDRFAVSPDGKTIYAPAIGRAKWFVVDAATGNLRTTVAVTGWPRNTMFSHDGARVFLGAWESTTLSVSDAAKHEIVKTVGPFSASLCPFTVNGKSTLVFANIDGLVGFEVGDLQTGLILDSVAVDEFDKAAAATYECPSHGIAFTPDERELWVTDGVRNRLHIFDATVYPPVERSAIDLTAQPRWVAFSKDGRYAYVSTGDIISAAARTIAGMLRDSAGTRVASEVFVQIDAR
jgi:DNA-binding beta-propeller fold protein YncE